MTQPGDVPELAFRSNLHPTLEHDQPRDPGLPGLVGDPTTVASGAEQVDETE